MSSSTKLIRGENDLVLTEAELALRGTEKKLAYTLSPSEIQDGAALTLEKVARIELLQRSKQIVDNMKYETISRIFYFFSEQKGINTWLI